MGVIDHQSQRALRRQVGTQPVQPVENGERGVRGDWGGGSKLVTGAGQAQQSGRHARRPVQQPSTLLIRHPSYNRLNQLTHDPEGEFTLQLGASRSQDTETPAFCHVSTGRQHYGLSDPRRSIHNQRLSMA
jgi:hypothetical protein